MRAVTATESASRGPAHRRADGSTTYTNLVFPATEGVFDLTVRGERITAIRKSDAAAEFLCLPPLADLHVHANRAYTPPSKRPSGLEDAVRNVADLFTNFSTGDYRRQADQLFNAAYCNGTTRIRTHADVGMDCGFAAVEGSLAAAEAVACQQSVEVVAFAGSSCDPATSAGADRLRDAVLMGAHYLGAVPAFCADPKATIDAVLDLALELNAPVDLHLDEHLEARRSYSGYLAKAVIERELQDRVTMGHGCAIAMLEHNERGRVIDSLAAARITVIALPRTNLYLQDAVCGIPRLRGVTPVCEMVAAGVEVRLASDNVRDAFYPYGDADLLGVAMDGILASHLDDPASVVAAICDGQSSVVENGPADMVLIPGNNFDAVLARPPRERWLLQAGQLSATSS